MTSSAWRPIDPVLPSKAMRLIDSGTLPPADEHLITIGSGNRGEQTVHAIQQSAVAGYKDAGILGAALPFDERLHQIAPDRGNANHKPEAGHVQRGIRSKQGNG